MEWMPEFWKAALLGQYELMNEMICNGANVNEPTQALDDPLTTLLHFAAGCGNERCVTALVLEFGANVNARDSKNRTPLHWAALQDTNHDVIEVLINKGAIVDARDVCQNTPLHHAVSSRYMKAAQKLIARGASIDAIDARGWSVLHMVVKDNNLEMLKMLISHRVNIDAKDMYDWTPLLYSIVMPVKEATEITELLLAKGADANSKTPDTEFSLSLAVSWNNLASIPILLKFGARVNEATDRGQTALHRACELGLVDMTGLLLKFGADLNARNQEGKTPFELLPSSPSNEAIAQIIIREADKREALGQPLCEGYKHMVQSYENYSKFDQEFREEIKRMQREKIDIEDSAISIFYIFSMDEEKLAALVRNEKIVMAFESSDYMVSFRIYAGELTTKFEAAKKRVNFLMSVEDCLGDVLGDMLPAPIIRKIAAYVKYNGDIIENEL